MLTGLGAPAGATVVMDAGIASEANLSWLRAQGYHYVVVSKLRERRFDPALATSTQSAGELTIKIQRVLDEQGHALLYCHSPAREQKDRAIDAAKTAGFEAVLLKLQAGLSKPRGTRDLAKIMERLGRAKQRYSRAAQHYQVELVKVLDGFVDSCAAFWNPCPAWSLYARSGKPVVGASLGDAACDHRGAPLTAHSSPSMKRRAAPKFA